MERWRVNISQICHNNSSFTRALYVISIIAVNYAARAKGVTRHMRGDEAKEQCPDIQLVKVPNVREKADLTKYREAGKEVATVLKRFTPLLERASVDEAYLDITDAVNKRLQKMNEVSLKLELD